MDPVTHALVGMALGLQSGEISLMNGAMAASIAGSVLPDLDIVFQLWGDYVYLKHHRGFSHSLPGAILISSVGGLLLSLFYPGYPFIQLLLWMFLGVISHSFLDLLNSYGLKIFWPLSSRKFTLNLLPLFDPILVTICLLSVLSFGKVNSLNSYLAFSIFIIYLLLRWVMRTRAGHLIRTRFQKNNMTLKVHILPAGIINLCKWDFIVELPQKNIVGSVNLFKGNCQVFQRLYRESEEISIILVKTVLGKAFLEFTPFFHINYEKKGDKLVCHFMDLRYRIKDRFLHNGTLVLNQKLEVEEAVFQPYSMSHRIYLT